DLFSEALSRVGDLGELLGVGRTSRDLAGLGIEPADLILQFCNALGALVAACREALELGAALGDAGGKRGKLSLGTFGMNLRRGAAGVRVGFGRVSTRLGQLEGGELGADGVEYLARLRDKRVLARDVIAELLGSGLKLAHTVHRPARLLLERFILDAD